MLLALTTCGDRASKLDVGSSSPGSGSRPLTTRALSTRAIVISSPIHTLLCGSAPVLSGTDASGTVTHGTATSCTVVFGTSGVRSSCIITGGTLLSLSDLMFTVSPLIGNTMTYSCTKGG